MHIIINCSHCLGQMYLLIYLAVKTTLNARILFWVKCFEYTTQPLCAYSVAYAHGKLIFPYGGSGQWLDSLRPRYNMFTSTIILVKSGPG